MRRAPWILIAVLATVGCGGDEPRWQVETVEAIPEGEASGVMTQLYGPGEVPETTPAMTETALDTTTDLSLVQGEDLGLGDEPLDGSFDRAPRSQPIFDQSRRTVAPEPNRPRPDERRPIEPSPESPPPDEPDRTRERDDDDDRFRRADPSRPDEAAPRRDDREREQPPAEEPPPPDEPEDPEDPNDSASAADDALGEEDRSD